MAMTDARTPSEARPGRMDPLARLPVFLALEGKRAVLAGGSAAVAWKADGGVAVYTPPTTSANVRASVSRKR